RMSTEENRQLLEALAARDFSTEYVAALNGLCNDPATLQSWQDLGRSPGGQQVRRSAMRAVTGPRAERAIASLVAAEVLEAPGFLGDFDPVALRSFFRGWAQSGCGQ